MVHPEMSHSRESILAAIRRATVGFSYETEAARDYSSALTGPEPILDLLVDRLLDYNAYVIDLRDESNPLVVRHAINEALQSRGISSVVVPSDLDHGIRPDYLEVTEDRGLSNKELDRIEAALTLSAVTVAASGTILLDHSMGQGRRVVTLLPDTHVCLVNVDSVVGTLPEAISKLGLRPVMTWISGPSATSDIELVRVEGVHGPRNLIVVIHKVKVSHRGTSN
jgi:L-lactate dehydrogenase complex protein LldG